MLFYEQRDTGRQRDRHTDGRRQRQEQDVQ